jgi:hypothetical protein
MPAKTTTPTWTFHTLASGHERTTELTLFWELDGDPMTDDYLFEDISAIDLWSRWRRQYPKDTDVEKVFGPGAMRIWWFVAGDRLLEGAPFQDNRGVSHPGGNFLEYFSWPEDARTRERVRWSALPVADKLWRKGRADKGGFIQEVTGWKPSPMQPFVNIHQLEQMAGLA